MTHTHATTARHGILPRIDERKHDKVGFDMAVDSTGALNGCGGCAMGPGIARAATFPGDLHIQPASPCNGAGTPNGAPALDMDGQPRDPMMPDIGADEL
jgi:hypothetical protein